MEIWKQHNDFNNYEFSNYGRVKRIDTGYILKETLFNRHGMKHKNDGYFITFLMNTTLNQRKRLKVHRIVGELFVENPDPIKNTIINHIDGIKNNNHYSNLEWVSVKENNRHATILGLNEKSKKINVDIVRQMRKEFIETDISMVDLAIKYDYTNVRSVLYYNLWDWVDEDDKDDYIEKVKIKLIKIKPIDNVNLETVNEILADYINGLSIKNIGEKHNLNILIITEIINQNELPHIPLLEGEIFMDYKDFKISNKGRVIKDFRIYRPVLIKKKARYQIMAELFLDNPDDLSKAKLIDSNGPCSLENIEWINETIISAELIERIINDYKESDTTRNELASKYGVGILKLNILLTGISWRDTPRYQKVIEATSLSASLNKHLCILCGDSNPNNFGRLKIKCKKCEYERVKPLRKNTYVKKGPKKHECLICNETNPDMFYTGGKTKCKKCTNNRYIKKEPKKHDCLTCGEANPDMFNGNKKSECRTCCSARKKKNYISVKNRA